MEWAKEMEYFYRQVLFGSSCLLMAIIVVSLALLENIMTCTQDFTRD
jgi:hypothetical protein